MTPTPQIPTWESVTDEALHHFDTEGFVVVKDALDIGADLEPIEQEYAALLDELCTRWYAEGRLSSTHADLDFSERVIRVLGEIGGDFHQHFNIGLPTRGPIRDAPIHLGPAIFNLLTSPRLAAALRPLIGPEIYSHPLGVTRFKVPDARRPPGTVGMGARTQWHQDLAFLLPDADNSSLVGAWVPIYDATAETGSLVVVPGSHRGGLLHTDQPNFHLDPADVPADRAVPIPVQRGSVLLLHPLIIHSSASHLGDRIRWSFDLRFHPADRPTGRPIFPGFLAHSEAEPDRALTDHRDWQRLWLDARDQLADRSDIIYESVRWPQPSTAG